MLPGDWAHAADSHAAAMGIGIWSMHFTGILAFSLPVPVSYYWPTILASLLVAVLASVLALRVASRKTVGSLQAVLSGITTGSGIAALHTGDN